MRALSDGGGRAAEVKRSRAGADRPLGWSTGPDYLLVLRSRHCQTVGLVELREEARNSFIANGLLADNASLQVSQRLQEGDQGYERWCTIRSHRGIAKGRTARDKRPRVKVGRGRQTDSRTRKLADGGMDTDGRSLLTRLTESRVYMKADRHRGHAQSKC